MKILYPCENKVVCSHVSHVFDKGSYLVELWGASGGNLSHGEVGGAGGYARAEFHISESKTLLFFIGASGFEGGTSGLTLQPYNGGGKGAYVSKTHSAASGGGSTDVRTNMSLFSRILVAGGGSGAAYNEQGSSNNGVCGGGISGADGKNSIAYGTSYEGGMGGSQTGGGGGRQSGIFGFGGNQTSGSSNGSGGGGGWYGGGSGHAFGATGGGGSGYKHASLMNANIISGCSPIPSFYHESLVYGHMGDGGVRITELSSISYYGVLFHSNILNLSSIILILFSHVSQF